MADIGITLTPVGGKAPGSSSGEQVTPASKPAHRIMTIVRRTGFGAVVRIVVPPGDASQMIAAIERITVSFTWAAAIAATLVIVTAASLPAGTVIAITGLELAGFAITLVATRWRRRRDRLGLPVPGGRGPGTDPHPLLGKRDAHVRVSFLCSADGQAGERGLSAASARRYRRWAAFSRCRVSWVIRGNRPLPLIVRRHRHSGARPPADRQCGRHTHNRPRARPRHRRDSSQRLAAPARPLPGRHAPGPARLQQGHRRSPPGPRRHVSDQRVRPARSARYAPAAPASG